MNLESLRNSGFGGTLNAATEGGLVAVMRDLLDLGLDPHVLVDRRGRDWVVLVLGLRGDQLVREHELPVLRHGLEEWVRLGVLSAYLDGVLLGAERWRRSFDRQLAALGARAAKSATS